MPKFLLITIFLVLTPLTYAFEEHHKTWIGLFGNKKFQESPYSFWQEIQYRFNLDNEEMQQLLTRFGMLKTLNENHQLGLLVAYVHTSPLAKEYRPTLQHAYTQNQLWFRSRLEFRVREDDKPTAIRYRLLARYLHPLQANRHFVIWDEPFINITSQDWTGRDTLDRNRLFIGWRFTQADHFYEVGYLNQYITRELKTYNEHALTLYFFY
jgi:hypothetical protein